jgi:hypothetical protein
MGENKIENTKIQDCGLLWSCDGCFVLSANFGILSFFFLQKKEKSPCPAGFLFYLFF